MSDSVQPQRWQPTRLPCPWDSPGKNTGVGCHLLFQCMKVKSESEVAQSCPTLRDPMDCSLPGSSFHGIFQAKVLEWGAIAFSNDQPRQHIKKQGHYLSKNVSLVKAMVFLVVMYGCESWTRKKAERQRIDAFELWCWRRLLRVSWDSKEIQPVYPKGNQSWIFIGRTDAETETPILWPPDVKNWLIGKDPDAGKDWSQEEKGMTEDEMVGWHHWLNEHEFE